MYQSTHSLQLNSDYMQHEALRDAEARRLARMGRSQAFEDQQRFYFHHFQRRLAALAVAVVTVLGVVAVI